MKKIVLLNSPPSGGKDTAANYLITKYNNVKTDKFARVLKERTHALYGFNNRPHNYYEDVKGIASEDFYGLTPRQAYINVSELYFKPVHGNDIFGKILADELDKYDWEINVISDSGFKEEAEVLIKKYGKENIILIRIIRPGFTFAGDSRNYIDLGPDICNIDITNNTDDSYLLAINVILEQIINNKNK